MHLRSVDLVAWSNYEEPGYAFSRGIDHVSDSWPSFRMRTEDDVTLAAYLTEQDREWDEVLTGESESLQRSWIAHPIGLPFAFDLIPWLWSRQDPRWWVRIGYAEVVDALRIETWEAGQPRRVVRISSELPWVIHGEPYAWESPFWDGRQPQGGEFAGAADPLTLPPAHERLDLSRSLVLRGGARGVAGGGLPEEYDADLGTPELHEGRVLWHGLAQTARATELAHRLPGSFVDDEGLAHIDLERAGLVPAPPLASDDEEWPDVEGLFHAALQHLLGVSTLLDLHEEHWTGLLLHSGQR